MIAYFFYKSKKIFDEKLQNCVESSKYKEMQYDTHLIYQASQILHWNRISAPPEGPKQANQIPFHSNLYQPRGKESEVNEDDQNSDEWDQCEYPPPYLTPMWCQTDSPTDFSFCVGTQRPGWGLDPNLYSCLRAVAMHCQFRTMF